jgi:hypothetical protein
MGGSVVVGEGAKSLHRPHLNDGHQKIGKQDAEAHPQRQLDGASAARTYRQPERDDRRYRRKSGLIKP